MAFSSMICAGNWKLNKSPQESTEFLNELAQQVPETELQNFALFLPALSLFTATDRIVPFGPQNIYFESSGAFTGENSAEVARGMGAGLALIGHSERRSLFHETSEDTAKKVKTSLASGLLPVLCLGETLEQREAEQTNEIIGEQLKVGLKDVDENAQVWLAYEPVWAIGTGKVATPEQAEAAHAHLRGVLDEIKGQEFAEKTPILYGGSVKPANAADLAKQPNINGFLIGGASLKVESFVEIYKQSNSALS